MNRRSLVKYLLLTAALPVQKAFAGVRPVSGNKKELAKKFMNLSLIKPVLSYRSTVEVSPVVHDADQFLDALPEQKLDYLNKLEDRHMGDMEEALEQEFTAGELARLNEFMEQKEFRKFVQFYDRRYKKIFSQATNDYYQAFSQMGLWKRNDRGQNT